MNQAAHSPMDTQSIASMKIPGFDDSNITWFPFGEFPHFVFTLLDIDEENNIADFMVKFAANEKIFLHKHLCKTSTLVVSGEHRLYEPSDEIKSIRPVGQYTSSPIDTTNHREGGGQQGAIVLYSVRPIDNQIFDIFDDDGNKIAELTMDDLKDIQRQLSA